MFCWSAFAHIWVAFLSGTALVTLMVGSAPVMVHISMRLVAFEKAPPPTT